MVLTAGRNDTTLAKAALEKLCQTYWYPLYAYIRRRGYSPQDAQDLTQAFFAHILEHHALGTVAPAKGRFRSFLLSAMNHFLANEWDKVRAVKRGGGQRNIPIQLDTAETRYGVEPAIVKAVVWRESRFDPRAVGRAGEMGLMQIRELAAVEWSSSQRVPGFEMNCLLDPGTNTLAGAWYLARVLRRYAQADDPLPYALADYNAGRNNVLRWNQGAAATNAAAFVAQIGFPSTRRYVQTVVRRRERYRDEFRSAP